MCTIACCRLRTCLASSPWRGGLLFPAMNLATSTATDPVLQRLVDQVRAAQADGRPLAIRGGGSKDFYGGVSAGEPLELGPLQGISSYEPTEMVITARAGTPLREIESVL